MFTSWDSLVDHVVVWGKRMRLQAARARIPPSGPLGAPLVPRAGRPPYATCEQILWQHGPNPGEWRALPA